MGTAGHPRRQEQHIESARHCIDADSAFSVMYRLMCQLQLLKNVEQTGVDFSLMNAVQFSACQLRNKLRSSTWLEKVRHCEVKKFVGDFGHVTFRAHFSKDTCRL